jgi:aminotransferase EvaB
MGTIQKIARKHTLSILEDCAQATGATYNGKKAGSMGDISAFSFYPTKIIGAYGDGGMVTTSNPELADKVRLLRMYGTRGDYYSSVSGYNSRLDELQAAILIWKLKRIESYIIKREKIANRYTRGLTDTPLTLPETSHNIRHVWHLYVIRSDNSEVIFKKMQENGITLGVHYRHPLHLQKGYQYLGYKPGDFPQAEKSAETVLSLPIYPELPRQTQTTIINALRKITE